MMLKSHNLPWKSVDVARLAQPRRCFLDIDCGGLTPFGTGFELINKLNFGADK